MKFGFALFTWALLILFFGYETGTGDQSEFLPYALYLYNHSLYPYDLYIQSMEAMVMNERFFCALFLSRFIPNLDTWTLIIHFITTLLLVLGSLKLAEKFIRNRFLQYAAVLCCLILFHGITINGNELYYNHFQGASLAKALTIWAFVYLLERKISHVIILLIIATFFQPLVGLHSFIICSAVLTYQTFILKVHSKGIYFGICSLYVITGGLYILTVVLSQRNQVLTKITDHEFIQIAYYFRMPHHFIPSYFSLKGILLISVLFLSTGIYFFKSNKEIFIIYIIILTGIIVYLTGVYSDSFLIISSWWFRCTVWLKLFGCIGIFALVEKYFGLQVYTKFQKMELTGFIILSALIISLVVFAPDILPFNKPYHTFSSKTDDEGIKICREIKNKVSNNAVFIQPFEFTALKYYGEKSSYVEFKTVSRRRDYLKIWYDRIRKVYNVDTEIKDRRELMKKADENFRKLNKESLLKLKTEGVTHILTYKDHIIADMKVVVENSRYKVYEL
ncbi:MAG: hypothetical protein K2X86_00275 [Cytophagaceae bacterium]|nr:hypothetical protein [Cytophagaceae bacterium]